ncbi:hypothetical protein BRPE64_ACDS11070 [Caballeronia insecticola]|uniref:Uncharacterized protein n=1 Tax=Caballeronia insecticola TaxID=758793 RepID=R4WVB1_9BURK|nr:hypothetical protein BRPE64_ACDS11070 [Caballeronia insecticola]
MYRREATRFAAAPMSCTQSEPTSILHPQRARTARFFSPGLRVTNEEIAACTLHIRFASHTDN